MLTHDRAEVGNVNANANANTDAGSTVNDNDDDDDDDDVDDEEEEDDEEEDEEEEEEEEGEMKEGSKAEFQCDKCDKAFKRYNKNQITIRNYNKDLFLVTDNRVFKCVLALL